MGVVSFSVGLVVGVLIVIGILLVIYRFYFLRRPRRVIPGGRTVVSPAYGRIVKILEISKGNQDPTVPKGLIGKVQLLTKDTIREGYVIVIMMTPLDVHFQRNPVDGIVKRITYRKGRFLNAVIDAGSLSCLQNERNEVLIEKKGVGNFKVVQVAGFVARRISCFLDENQKIHKGKVLGVISLGSQVILVLPRLSLEVSEGQRVVDGETIIARY